MSARWRWRPRAVAPLLLWGGLLAVIWYRTPSRPRFEVARPPDEGGGLRIDLNRAPWQHLLLIEGIGEALAQRIVEQREVRGGFRSLREVMDVPGVPDRPLERARPYLSLDGCPIDEGAVEVRAR